MQQYRIAASTPGMEQQAAALLGMLPKMPPGAYIAVDGSMQVMPGAANTTAALAQAEASGKGAGQLRYAGPIASAEAWGKAPAQAWEKWHSPMEGRAGGVIIDPATGRPVYQVPLPVDTVNAQGQTVRQYIQPAMAGPPNGPGGGGNARPQFGSGLVSGSINPYGPGGAQSGAPIPSSDGASAPANTGAQGGYITKLSPTQDAELTGRGKTLAEQTGSIDEDATSAVQGNFLLDQMRNESQSWRMGKFADFEGSARAYLQAFGTQFNLKTPDLDKQLGDFQSFVKNAGNLTRTATRSVSSRAGVQEMQLIQSSLPSPEMSGRGFNQVADQLQSVNDFSIAKQTAAQQWRDSHQGTLEGFNIDFNSKVGPAAFLIHRMDADSLQQMAANMQKTPDGRAALKRLMDQVSYAQANKYFGP
jgi:hypothetical protein